MIKALYVHIPFCRQKCNYCDFHSIAVAKQKADSFDDYSKALQMELKMQSHSLDLRNLETLYIGGGTPTCLSLKQLNAVFSCLNRLVDFSRLEEITVEANPGTLSEDILSLFEHFGVSRISLGVQSFDDQLLITMNRIHSADQAIRSIETLHKRGWKNISIDLIYGLPDQSVKSWIHTLQQAITLDVSHISAYGLTLEENTPWGAAYKKGTLVLPDEDDVFQMYHILTKQLDDKKYRRYEISNYCKENHESLHNMIYWKNEEYLGVGSGAASHYCNKRVYTVADVDVYIKHVLGGELATSEEVYLDREEQMAETIFMNLRMVKGLDVEIFQRRFGVSLLERFEKPIQRLCDQGLLVVEGGHVKLTQKAFPVANLVFEAFLP